MNYAFFDDEAILAKHQVLADRLGVLCTTDYEPYLNPESPQNIYDQNCKVYIVGRGVYEYIHRLNQEGKLHFGIRGYNYTSIRNLPVFSFKNLKIIFGYPENLIGDEHNDSMIRFIKLDPNEKSKYSIDNYDIVTVDQGIEYLEKHFSDPDQELGFDFESKSFPNEWDFEPVGIGISSESYGLYIDFRYYSSKEKLDEFMKYFENWVDKHQTRLWCFFCSFEVNALKVMFHKLFRLNDVMSLLKADCNSANLKLSAQYYLRIGAWDTEQDEYSLVADDAFNLAESYDEFMQKVDNFELEAIDANDVLNDYGFDRDILKRYWGHSFAVPPSNIIGKYCVMDSYYTLMLYKVIDGKYNFIGDLR